MGTGRKPQQVARRALILGAIAFRSSLEVTDHPRVFEISQRLLPWLKEVECDDELDPIEHALLATPLGQLSDSQRIDARWAGESATLFCWMLKLVGPPDPARPADQTVLPYLLSILRPGAMDIVRSASLREDTEILDVCRYFVLVRSILQEARVSPSASEIVRTVNLQKLNEVGLIATEDAVKRASEAVGCMTASERQRVAGLCFVRAHAALWYLSDCPNYFA